MKIDSIVKEELWRSVAVYFISFIAVGILIMNEYLPVPLSYTFSLAVIPTAAHFFVMVWYRRKENLTDPTPTNILRHALRLGEQREEKTKQRKAIVEKVVDAILVVTIFLIYLYASLADSINQALWLPVLVIIGLLLTRIVFTDGGERRITPARSVVFYLIVAGVLILRYLILEYPVVPFSRHSHLSGSFLFLLSTFGKDDLLRREQTDGWPME